MKKNIRGFAFAAAVALAGMAVTGCSSAVTGVSQPAATQAPQTTADAGNAPAASDGAEVNTADLPAMTLSIGHNNSTDSLMQFVAEQMKAQLEEKSGGKLTVNIYPSGQLGSESDMVTSCQTGDLTFLISGLHALVNNVPEASIVNIPYLYENAQQAREVFADEGVRNYLNDGFAKANMRLVLLGDQGFRCLTTNKEITGIDSLAGLNIRTLTNKDQVEAWKMLGANPTPIDFSELYLSLQQGVIDSQENPYDIIDSNKFYEVQKYFTNSNHMYHTISVTIGTSTYDSMPAEYQKMIDEVCADAEQKSFVEADSKMDGYKQHLIDSGMTFVDFDQIDGMRDQLKEKTAGAIDIVRASVQNDAFVDHYMSVVNTVTGK